MLMKLTPGVNLTNILRVAFVSADHDDLFEADHKNYSCVLGRSVVDKADCAKHIVLAHLCFTP